MVFKCKQKKKFLSTEKSLNFDGFEKCTIYFWVTCIGKLGQLCSAAANHILESGQEVFNRVWKWNELVFFFNGMQKKVNDEAEDTHLQIF